MALYVVPIDTPAPGVDWATVVPGQYLWNVTGITATLATATVDPDTAYDYTGGGHNGGYDPQSGSTVFVPGAFTGDDALQLEDPIAFTGGGFDNNASANPLTGDFTLMYWRRATGLNTGPDFIFYAAGFVPLVSVQAGTTSTLHWNGANPGECEADTGPFHFPLDNTWHLIAFAYNAGTGRMSIYLDGVLQTLVTDIAGPITAGIVSKMFMGFDIGGNYNASGAADEYVYVESALSAGQLAALHATAPDWNAWTAAVLALTPLCAYHLDASTAPGVGRQVDLLVTDGTSEVLEIPTGFAPPAPPGPFGYSWNPALRSSTQTPTSEAIAVAVPALVLPAGYTIGARTLDIGATDQWSDVTLWWDSDVQDRQTQIDPYAYPPGALLRFTQRQG